MAKVWTEISNWFWSESFWLPQHVNWTHFERDETIFIPQPLDLFIPIPIALGLFIARFFWERLIATPIGRYFKLRETSPTPPVYNQQLEVAFKKHRKILPRNDNLVALSKQLDWSTRQIERWWRRRRVQGKASELTRFKETSWRFLFYIFSFYYGLAVLWNKNWLWDTKNCWYGWPRQHVPTEIWWYYMLELGFYWSLMMSLMTDVKRKDFLENVVHHFVTILLMCFSWADNFVRVGTLVLLVHDAVDYWLEGAKLAKYLKFHKLCDALFVIFTVVWFVTRIVLFPIKIIYPSLYEATEVIQGMAPAYFVFNGLLLALQFLHVVWFFFIIKAGYVLIVRGQVEKDERSETEPDSESADEKEILREGASAMHAANATSNGPVLRNGKSYSNGTSGHGDTLNNNPSK